MTLIEDSEDRIISGTQISLRDEGNEGRRVNATFKGGDIRLKTTYVTKINEKCVRRSVIEVGELGPLGGSAFPPATKGRKAYGLFIASA